MELRLRGDPRITLCVDFLDLKVHIKIMRGHVKLYLIPLEDCSLSCSSIFWQITDFASWRGSESFPEMSWCRIIKVFGDNKISNNYKWSVALSVKFRFSEKATKIWKNLPISLTLPSNIKGKRRLFQIFVAFSECLNFNSQNWMFRPYLKTSWH